MRDNAILNCLCELMDGGALRVYGGDQPTSADMPVTNQPILATFPLGPLIITQGKDPAVRIQTDGVQRRDDERITWLRIVDRSGSPLWDSLTDAATVGNMLASGIIRPHTVE